MDGGEVLAGGNGVTAAVGLDCAVVDPLVFVAVTTERIILPTSLACTA